MKNIITDMVCVGDADKDPFVRHHKTYIYTGTIIVLVIN